MTSPRRPELMAFVHEARLVILPPSDPAGPGGAVTTALCGHWKHDGVCRWPHNNVIDTRVNPATFVTLFVADQADEPEIRARIDRALRDGSAWSLVSSGPRNLLLSEEPLAQRLRAGAATS